MRGWSMAVVVSVVAALELTATVGCSSSDLDDLCRQAAVVTERRDQPPTAQIEALFSEWKPTSRQGLAIREAMIRDGEIASYGVFRKLLRSKATTAWECPALERLMVAPVTADADQLCLTSGTIAASDINSKNLGSRLTEKWTPTSTWGTTVHGGLRAAATDDLVARIERSYSDETGHTWSCPALVTLVRAATRNDLARWCELAEMIDRGQSRDKPVHLRRAKMQQLTGSSLSFTRDELRALQREVDAELCPALERVLGLGEVSRTIEAIADDSATGGDDPEP